MKRSCQSTTIIGRYFDYRDLKYGVLQVHVQAHRVLNDIGLLTHMTCDFADCYYDAGPGTDIQVRPVFNMK